MLYNVESLAIPGANVINATATKGNFCAGYLRNMVYQDVWENAFYILGTLFYLAVLKRTTQFNSIQFNHLSAGVH